MFFPDFFLNYVGGRIFFAINRISSDLKLTQEVMPNLIALKPPQKKPGSANKRPPERPKRPQGLPRRRPKMV